MSDGSLEQAAAAFMDMNARQEQPAATEEAPAAPAGPEASGAETLAEGVESPAPEASPEVQEAVQEAIEEQPGQGQTEQTEQPAPERFGLDELDPSMVISGIPQPGGATVDVTLQDLARSYSQEASYTQRSQALAERERELETATQATTIEHQQRLAQLDQLSQALQTELQQLQPNPAEDAELQRTDPGLWAARQAERTRREQIIAAGQQAVADEQQRQLQARIPQERNALMRMSPEFAANFEDQYARVGAYVTSPTCGFTPGEWGATIDARLIRMAEKAMLYDAGNQAASARPKRVQKSIRALPKIRPGTSEPSNAAESEHDRAMKHLRETGQSGTQSTRDVQNAFLAIERRRGGA